MATSGHSPLDGAGLCDGTGCGEGLALVLDAGPLDDRPSGKCAGSEGASISTSMGSPCSCGSRGIGSSGGCSGLTEGSLDEDAATCAKLSNCDMPGNKEWYMASGGVGGLVI